MSAAEILSRLRRFLMSLAFVLFVGTLAELWLVNHTEDAIQWLPFVLCGLALSAIVVAVFKRNKATTFFLRLCMVLAIGGSALGIYLHVSNNMAFENEIHPSTTGVALLMKGLSGANPLLAPGTLAVAALLALASTYKNDETGKAV
jgi:hypothetical protein